MRTQQSPSRNASRGWAEEKRRLLLAPLNLGEGDLRDAPLEAPLGGGKRIDIQAQFTVIEVKKDLRSGSVRDDAISSVEWLSQELPGQRYVSVLNDGAEWRMYLLVPSGEL